MSGMLAVVRRVQIIDSGAFLEPLERTIMSSARDLCVYRNCRRYSNLNFLCLGFLKIVSAEHAAQGEARDRKWSAAFHAVIINVDVC